MIATAVDSRGAEYRTRAWWTPAIVLAAAGWGANQFAPLISLYRIRLDLSAPELDAIYGLYAFALVPALIGGGRLSDRIGRRRIIVVALVLLVAASVMLMIGGESARWLYAGRVVAGIGCGLAFSAGTAWLKEACADPGRAARRATVSLTAGFAVGPLVAGCLAQWSSTPSVTPYLPHLVIVVVALVLVACATAPPTVQATGHRAGRLPARLLVTFFIPFPPWVFGTAAVFLAYLTPLVALSIGRNTLVFAAVAACVGAVAGIAGQPVAERLHRSGEQRLVNGAMSLVVVVVGLLLGAWAAYAGSVVLVLADSVLLGMAYGVCQLCGLRTVQRVAPPEALGTMIAIYQVLSYTGFAFPYLMSLSREWWSLEPWVPVLALAAVATAAATWLALCRPTSGVDAG